ncbi:MAG: hypothetical protein FD187_1977 [bacterium]|nr:MAG: hypothetical protein FD142_1631 [bacterium]KAF0148554.1 MAG: hypothetical protein FD187_1977 [bacterium]KAF0167278.1 MAG: hypothetical protein FD158_2425 [bacterium]TXT20711.1 MAG: hypothetical protein FD132_1078 [bacterium]
MIWDIVEGNWKQFKYKLKTQWHKLAVYRRGVIACEQVMLVCRIPEKSPEARSVTEDIPSRRLVLRGAVAMGFGLLLPVSLLGCDAKKGASSSSGDTASPPASSGNAAAPETSEKASQASVQYQAQPKGERKCAGCMHFEAGSGTCKVVDGQISPEGWCTLWAKNA